MSRESFTYRADRAGETAVVTLAGELDMAATFRVEPELERLTRNTEVKTLVADLNGVEFMDSSGLGLLLATEQRLRADGVRFVVANPSHSVRRMLELTGTGDELAVMTWPATAT